LQDGRSIVRYYITMRSRRPNPKAEFQINNSTYMYTIYVNIKDVFYTNTGIPAVNNRTRMYIYKAFDNKHETIVHIPCRVLVGSICSWLHDNADYLTGRDEQYHLALDYNTPGYLSCWFVLDSKDPTLLSQCAVNVHVSVNLTLLLFV
jgi:hypothetical protein